QPAKARTYTAASDTVEVAALAEGTTGSDARSFHSLSRARTSVAIAGQIGLEAGYLTDYKSEHLLKIDGFTGPLDVAETRHGPAAALVIGEGTNQIRAGYRYETGWSGNTHSPMLSATLSIRRTDTLAAITYRHVRREISVPAEKLPAGSPIDSRRDSDLVVTAVEQGLPAGWLARIEIGLEVQSGFLQSPFRLVTLWSDRTAGSAGSDDFGRTLPERHPDHRTRWAVIARILKGFESIAGALEFSAGAGNGNWRVERHFADAGWRQRLTDKLMLAVRAGIYHQTRAVFYLNDYTGAAPHGYWSADPELSSYLAWLAGCDVRIDLYQDRKRLFGLFEHLHLNIGTTVLQRIFDWRGLDAAESYTGWERISGGNRVPFEQGLGISSWLIFVGGF
ncbi:MAG: DUF3570 domain-containing protein, partial [Deltaproteobacteria bacterium]